MMMRRARGRRPLLGEGCVGPRPGSGVGVARCASELVDELIRPVGRKCREGEGGCVGDQGRG